ncbi:MAG: antibiotic biosynthesis monooxygenase [Clostridia bacterium]|nr:antibiotic biosynthesis monooxygenase [Clostridia bacterium]
MYILHVTYKVKAGQMDNWLARLKEIDIVRKSLDEPGAVQYRYYRPLEGGNELFLLEMWDSVEAQKEHTMSPHFKELAAAKAEFIEETVIEDFVIPER